MNRIVLLLCCTSIALAQVPSASLWIAVTPGRQTVNLTVPVVSTTAVPTPAALPSALALAAGCRESDIDPDEGFNRITVHCAPTHPDALTIHTALRAAELGPLLREAGVREVNVILTLPKFGSVRVNGAIAPERSLFGAYQQMTYAVDQLPQEIVVDAGFDQTHIFALAAGTAGLLLAPFLLLVFRPKNLLELHVLVQGLFIAGCSGWTWATIRGDSWALCDYLLKSSLLGSVALTVPPLLAVWIGSWLAAGAYSRLATGSVDATAFRRTKFGIGAAAVCIYSTLAGVTSAIFNPGEASEPLSAEVTMLGGLFVGLLAAGFFLLRAKRSSRGSSHPLAPGPLRTRVLQLAATAGVGIRDVKVLTGPTSGVEPRPAAAFASRTAGVLLSDGLIQRLSIREVDAVVCHELSHLQPVRQGSKTLLWAAVAATMMAAQFAPGVTALIPLTIPVGFLAFKAWRRSNEFTSDLNAARWSGDPEALITGLTRVSLANGMPLEWGPPIAWLVSHPSTMDRLRTVADAGGIQDSRFAELLEESHREPADHYVETNRVPEGAAFSPALRRRLATWLTGYALIGPLTLGLVFDRSLAAAGLNWPLILALGCPLSMIAFYCGYELLVGSVRKQARRRAIARHGAGTYVGFSPSAEPRIYDGSYQYDSGMMRVREGKLEFAGDRVSFSLDRRLVDRVWLGDGPRHWTPRKVVCIECRPASDAAPTIFSLQSLEARFWPFTNAAARRLYEEVEAWARMNTTATSTSTDPVAACALPDVTGEPNVPVRFALALKAAVVSACIAFVIAQFLWRQSQSFTAPVLCGALSIFASWPRLRPIYKR